MEKEKTKSVWDETESERSVKLAFDCCKSLIDTCDRVMAAEKYVWPDLRIAYNQAKKAIYGKV